MAAKGYEVIADNELTVLRTVSSLPQLDGGVIHQNGMGRTYVRGEVIPPELVAEDWKQALDEEDGPLYAHLSKVLKPVDDNPVEDSVARLGLPFEGYDDMNVDDIVRAMSVLPSATIMRIKEFESAREDPRTEIVDYNIGYGEHPDDRQLAELEVEETAEGKAAGRLTTRNVPDSGPVQRGEGYTGTGDPQKPYGATKDAEDGDEVASRSTKASRGRSGNVAKARRGRRDRSPQVKPGSGEKTSLESSND